MKKTLFCILCLFLCISMLGIIPAAMAENAPVRVGELIWIQEDENQRSASIARIRKVRDAILSIRSDENEQMEGALLSKSFYADWYAYLVRKE